MINLKDIINKPKFSNEIIINNIYKIMLLSKIDDEWFSPTSSSFVTRQFIFKKSL